MGRGRLVGLLGLGRGLLGSLGRKGAFGLGMCRGLGGRGC